MDPNALRKLLLADKAKKESENNNKPPQSPVSTNFFNAYTPTTTVWFPPPNQPPLPPPPPPPPLETFNGQNNEINMDTSTAVSVFPNPQDTNQYATNQFANSPTVAPMEDIQSPFQMPQLSTQPDFKRLLDYKPFSVEPPTTQSQMNENSPITPLHAEHELENGESTPQSATSNKANRKLTRIMGDRKKKPQKNEFNTLLQSYHHLKNSRPPPSNAPNMPPDSPLYSPYEGYTQEQQHLPPNGMNAPQFYPPVYQQQPVGQEDHLAGFGHLPPHFNAFQAAAPHNNKKKKKQRQKQQQQHQHQNQKGFKNNKPQDRVQTGPMGYNGPKPIRSPMESSPRAPKPQTYEAPPPPQPKDGRVIVNFSDHPSDDDFTDSDADSTDLDDTQPNERKRKRSLSNGDEDDVARHLKRIRETYMQNYSVVAEPDIHILESKVQKKADEKQHEEEALKSMQETLRATRQKLFDQQRHKISLEAKRRNLEEELRLTEESIKSSTNEQEASRLKIKLHENMISRKQAVINELEDQHNSLSLELYEINTHNEYVKELSNQKKEKNSSSHAPPTPLASTPKKTPAPKPTPPQRLHQPAVQKKQAETPKPRAISPPIRMASPQADAVEQMKKYLSDLEKKRELMKSKLKPTAAPTNPDTPQPSTVAPQPVVEQANSTPSKKKKKKKKVQEEVQPIPNLNTNDVFYYLHESPPVFFLESYGTITRYSPAPSLFGLLQEQSKTTDSEYHTASNGSQTSTVPESSINNLYESPLVAFRSYRLSAAFQELYPRESVVSSSLATKIDPMVQFCLYESHGECKDPDCKLQHRRDYKLDDTQIIKQLLAYAGDDTEVLQLQDE